MNSDWTSKLKTSKTVKSKQLCLCRVHYSILDEKKITDTTVLSICIFCTMMWLSLCKWLFHNTSGAIPDTLISISIAIPHVHSIYLSHFPIYLSCYSHTRSIFLSRYYHTCSIYLSHFPTHAVSISHFPTHALSIDLSRYPTRQGMEPPSFTGFFGVWDRDLWSKGLSFEEMKKQIGEDNVPLSQVKEVSFRNTFSSF